METDSPVVYHGTSESRFPPQEIQKHLTKLTAQDKEVFQACNRESLYYRCLPFAVVGMAATQIAVRKGYLTSHPIFGPGLKMTGAAFVGWILGKISYRKKCEDKFLTLENSVIGDAIRKSRGYTIQRHPNDVPNTTEDELGLKDDMYTTYSDDYYSSSGSLNLDVDKNIQYSGLDDRERPSTDRETMSVPEEIEPIREFTTYEDLRRRNREEYDRSQRSYRPDQTPIQRPWSNVDSFSSRKYSTDPREEKTWKNMYDDTWPYDTN